MRGSSVRLYTILQVAREASERQGTAAFAKDWVAHGNAPRELAVSLLSG